MQPATSSSIAVLVCDSNQLQSQLLVEALAKRPDFEVRACPMETDAVLASVATFPVDVAVMNVGRSQLGRTDLAPVRRLNFCHPEIAKILVLGTDDGTAVVEAFRAGARGLFSFADNPFRLLCKCIQSVHAGQVWASMEQLQRLVEAVTQVPSLRVVDSRGVHLLTAREEQVVALVADGLSNREVANELRLSEHTVKKYLFRIFDKLGISSRVELVLYAVGHGTVRQAEWVAGGANELMAS